MQEIYFVDTIGIATQGAELALLLLAIVALLLIVRLLVRMNRIADDVQVVSGSVRSVIDTITQGVESIHRLADTVASFVGIPKKKSKKKTRD